MRGLATITAAACALAFGGTTVMAERPEPIEVTRMIEASASEVWAAWTTPEGFGAVFDGPVLHDVELETGGAYEIHWDPSAPEGERGSEGCEVLSFVPERMLSFTWNAPPTLGAMREEHSQVVVMLDPLGPGTTRVTLRQHGFGDTDGWREVRAYFAEAWPWVMDQFAARFADGDDAGGRPSGWLLLLNPAREDFFETGPTPEEGASIGGHFRRLLEQTRAGVVLFAGPCTDEVGPGIVLFEAADEAAARAFVEADPAVAAGTFRAELHPINFSLLRERDRL